MHQERRKSVRWKQCSSIIACILAIGCLTPSRAAEVDEKSAIALEKLADEQFAVHDIECIENYRDTVFAWSTCRGKFSDRLRAIEKLCQALTFGRQPNSLIYHNSTREVAENVVAIGIVPIEELPKMISVFNCSDGFSERSAAYQSVLWGSFLQQVTQTDLKDLKEQEKCLKKVIPAMDAAASAGMAFSALSAIQSAKCDHSVTQDVRNALEQRIADISTDCPEFSILTPEQVETFHHCRISAAERSLQSLQTPDLMTAFLAQELTDTRKKLLQILLKQEPSFDPNDCERELTLGWCCNLCGEQNLARKYYSNALQRINHILSESKLPQPILTSTKCLAELSLVNSDIAVGQLKEAQSYLEEVKPLIATLPEIHAHGFRELILPLQGELAWKAGRLSEAESMLAQANKKFESMPHQNELSHFLRGHQELKDVLPGEEKTLSALIEVLKLEHKYPEAKKKQIELTTLQNTIQKSDKEDKFQRLPYFPGSRSPADAKQLAPAYIKAITAINDSDDARLHELNSFAQKSLDASLFETARIFVDHALLSLEDKTDDRAQSFKTIFRAKQIRINVETGKFDDALAEIEAFTNDVKPTNKDVKLEILDVKGWQARMLLYQRKYSEAEPILESICSDWRQSQQNSELSDHQRDHVVDLARVYLAQKKYDLAESTICSYIKELGSGPSDAQFNHVQILLASLYARKKHTGLANTMISEGSDQLDRFNSDSINLDAAYATFALGDFFKQEGNNIRAERYNSKASGMLSYLGLVKY